jgi:protein-S-isoprenylcysteine O-methyltransferase Ste14
VIIIVNQGIKQFLLISYALFFVIVFFGANYLQKKHTKQKIFALVGGKTRQEYFIEIFPYFIFLLWSLALYTVGFIPNISFIEMNLLPLDFSFILGFLLMFSGVILFAWVRWTMAGSWRVGIDTGTTSKLITSGPFRFSRNPTYISLYIMHIGSYFISQDLLFLFLLGIYLVANHLLILEEERKLDRIYGEPYRAFKQRTGRYLWKI